ncbi:amino acid/polyamine/organocation transporter (APC superfamily) [Microterricola gilva]|uniref:Amino acid/polyamine/organocation transporter (APC superfamily) n=2 Tax=Microterricola gilva TaxID=393267 RepID=A0A4Q8AMV1_9MICO|nr:amino acid/polyamine/organocation transporter (APC superfamily) [Microterricola gilva]
MAIGLASMVGAGVFFVWAPAAAVAGSGLLIGLLIAAVVATLNALSSAQLAMAHPVSGGAYAYGRALLGPWWGFSAGWLFLAGKTASAGAIALIAGGYLWPGNERLVAVAVILVLGTVNALGVRSTARVSGAVVAVVLAGLCALLVLVALWLAAGGQIAGGTPAGAPLGDPDAGWLGILQSAGLLFFCFAGYARMATLGEEARNPRHTLPRAILAALGVALVLYAAVGTACVLVLGPDRLARSTSPLAELAAVVTGANGAWGTTAAAGGWVLVVSLVAALACLGSLLGILAGLSRTGLAMARDSELPGALSRVSARTSSPVVAEASVAVLAIAAVLLLDSAWLVGFSATCVLVYYAIAHLAALRQPRAERWLNRAVPIVGVIGCTVLAFTLPWQGVLIAALVLGIGVAARGIRLARLRTAA